MFRSVAEERPRTLDGLLLSFGAFCVYVLFGQGSFYKVDGQALLYLSHLGVTKHGYHTFYLPLLGVLKSAVAPLGANLFEAATLLSAVGTAVGVLLGHTAFRRLGLDRFATNVATTLFALSPGVLFFATVVEVHGAFLPFAGVAMLAMAHASRSPRPWNALLLGLTLGLAYLAHPTGALMICLVPVAQAIADHENDVRTTWLRRGAVLLLAGVGLTAVLLIVPRLLRSGGAAVDVGAAAAIVRAFSTHGFSLLRLPEVFLDEWLVPFFAASVLALLAARFRDARPLVGFLLLGLLPYVIGAQLMLSDYSERGAYLLPVAWPTAALAVHALRRKEALTWFAIAFTAVTAIVQVELHDHPARPRAYAEGLRAIAGESGFQLLAGHELDVEAWLVAFEEAPVVYLGQFVDQDEAGIAVTLRHLDEWILSNHVRGRSTFLSDLGMQSIREAARRGEWPLSHDPELWVGARAADEILTHLESHYALLPVHQAGFSGYRLLPRR